MRELDAYFRSCIAARRKDPGSDLLSLLLAAEEQGKITRLRRKKGILA
jgi:cytochrome P450